MRGFTAPADNRFGWQPRELLCQRVGSSLGDLGVL